MSDITLSRANELKESLSVSINKLIKEFSRETGLTVERIELVRLTDYSGKIFETLVDIEVKL
jgi:hypothetical protein